MNEIDTELVRRVATRFALSFPGEAPHLVAAPGRVNLIGEHTDYNDGFVLPMAIERGCGRSAPGRRRAARHSVNFRAQQASTGSIRQAATLEQLPRGRGVGVRSEGLPARHGRLSKATFRSVPA